MVWRALKTFIKDPVPATKFEEVVLGLNVVEGIAKTSEPLRSPVRGQNCIAFYYRSFFMMTGGRAPAVHKLKQAEVYSPFELQMEGGVLSIVPAKPGKFEREEHTDLSQQYGKGFQGVEEVVLPGAKVRARGKVTKTERGLVLRMSSLDVIEKQAVAAGVVGDRKKRKKKKKR